MVATAFKPGRDILLYDPKWLPSPFTLDNFREAIDRPYFWDAVKNSLIVVSVVVLLSLVLAFLAALALAKFRFYGRKAFIVAIIAVQMIPLNGLIIPLYILLARAGQIDKLSGVIVTYLTFALPFTVWTLRGFILGVPRELEEAAMVDGSSRFGAFVRILLPLIAPGLVATSIYAFILAWNEFLLAYIFLSSPENQTLMVWLAAFTTSPRHRLGAADGRVDAGCDPRDRLLPARAPADRIRAHGRRRSRLSAGAGRRGACLLPGLPGARAA